MNDAHRKELFRSLVASGRLFDLSHEISPDMPVFREHPPYSIVLNRRHGDPHKRKRHGGSSFVQEIVTSTMHVSTHIDAIGHFSCNGLVHGGRAASSIESSRGLTDLDIADTPPIIRRGVLLDVAAHRGVGCMEPGDAIDAAELEEIAKKEGLGPLQDSVVLVRCGWSHRWNEPEVFSGEKGLPGVSPNGAEWLISSGVYMVGSDTPAFEVIPFQDKSVHCMLLVDRGIQIIENLNLESLSEAKVYEFLFIAAPLRIVGATASPLRPLALA